MSAKKAFIILLRIVFVFSSLQFTSDAFDKWDGYSFYMKFMVFVPGLSLTYVFVTLYAVIIAALAWLGIYILYLIIPKLLKIHFEHLLTWFIACFLLLFTKKIFFKSVSLTNLFGLNYFAILIIGSILVSSIVWLLRRHNKKIICGLNSRITPLVWLFVLLFILAVPLSLLQSGSSGVNPDGSEYVANAQNNDETVVQANRPNIILVVMDSLTTQDMQLHGYDRPTTPFISEWANNSKVMDT
jgi:hypothetical protein